MSSKIRINKGMTMRKLIEAVTPPPLAFEPMSTRFSIVIDIDRFTALLDTESYRTDNIALQQGNTDLGTKLQRETVARDVEYDGHFGAHIVLTIETDEDSPQARAKILQVINDHLAWCEQVVFDNEKE